jgi:hypothetical protein
MLSSAFGCFVVVLFLLALFTAEPSNNILLLWLSVFSLLLSIFLFVAVFVSRYHQTFYMCTKILDKYFIAFWIFMFIPVAALGKIIDVLNNMSKTPALEPYLLVINAILIVCGIFFIAYFVAGIWLSFRLRRDQVPKKPIPLSLQIAFQVSVVIWLVMIISNKWPTQFPTASYGYIILLIPVLILLSVYVKKASRQQVTATWALAFVVLTIISVVMIWLLHASPGWLWFCFGLLTIAIILMGIRMKRLEAANKGSTKTA